jgi:hypothetical protein
MLSKHTAKPYLNSKSKGMPYKKASKTTIEPRHITILFLWRTVQSDTFYSLEVAPPISRLPIHTAKYIYKYIYHY